LTEGVGVGLLVLASPLIQAASAQPTPTPSAYCSGFKASIVSGLATVNGTAGSDIIVVTGTAAHTVNAGDGNDIICGSAAIDTISGGEGNDTINGQAGLDVIDGDNGNDAVNIGVGDTNAGVADTTDTVSNF
jgi:hypothetical protein